MHLLRIIVRSEPSRRGKLLNTRLLVLLVSGPMPHLVETPQDAPTMCKIIQSVLSFITFIYFEYFEGSSIFEMIYDINLIIGYERNATSLGSHIIFLLTF